MGIKKGRWIGDESSRQMFQLRAKNPDVWFGNAESYERAASVLFDIIKKEATITGMPNGKGGIAIPVSELQTPVGGPHALLAGLAIENELKAILVALDPDKFVTEKGLHKDFLKHNLQKLADKANNLRPGIILLDEAKIAILDRLWLAIESGRYNIGRTPREFNRFFQQGFGVSGGKGGPGLKYERKLTPEGDAFVIDELSGEIGAFNDLFGTLKRIYRLLLSPANDW